MPKSNNVLASYFFLFSIVLTFFISNFQIDTFALQQTVVKHLVGLTLIGSSFLLFSSSQMSGVNFKKIGGCIIDWWALICLAFMMLAGSLYARLFLGIEETFFVHGFYILVGYLFSLSINEFNINKVISIFIRALILTSIPICLATIYGRLNDFHVKDTPLHEREFYIIPVLYLLIFTDYCQRWWRWLLIFIFLFAAIAELKNTSNLVLLLVGLFVGLRLWHGYYLKIKNIKQRLLVFHSGISLFFLASFTAAAGIYFVGTQTQDTNIDFRQFQYAQAWDQFIESPVYGFLFSQETGIYFSLWVDDELSVSVFPTHNDVLDILRGGGLIAFFLWIVPMSRVSFMGLKVIANGNGRGPSLYIDLIAWMIIVNISAVIVYLFNPIISKTGFSAIIWMNYGLLWSLINLQPRVKVC